MKRLAPASPLKRILPVRPRGIYNTKVAMFLISNVLCDSAHRRRKHTLR